jgi:hypothetical protein
VDVPEVGVGAPQVCIDVADAQAVEDTEENHAEVNARRSSRSKPWACVERRFLPGIIVKVWAIRNNGNEIAIVILFKPPGVWRPRVFFELFPIDQSARVCLWRRQCSVDCNRATLK